MVVGRSPVRAASAAIARPPLRTHLLSCRTPPLLALGLALPAADPAVQAYWANENIPNELADDVREPSFLSFLAPTYKTLLWWGAGGQVTKAHYDTYDNVVRPPTNRTLPRCSNSS